MDYLKLTPDRLSVEEIADLVTSPRCGAISIFSGTARDNFEGKEVVQLEYEAYESMALKVMKEICGEVREKWSNVEHIAIYHRLGVVPIQQSSVIIAISSPHRVAALEATQFCIDTLKSRVPIWKKEKYAGEVPSQWKENEECPWKNENEEEDEDSTKNVPSSVKIDVDLVQVKASNKELMLRIQRFMEQKRELVNMTNVLDFCVPNPRNVSNDGEINSCARVDAVLVARKDSKSHLRVRRVENLQGPQTMSVNVSRNMTPNNPVDERLMNAEEHLLLNGPVPVDIYERIKRIEERILQLESISPEYCQFWKNIPATSLPPIQTVLSAHMPIKKRRCSINDIERRIESLQRSVYDSS